MEAKFLAWLRRRLPTTNPPVEVGPGDDAAVVALGADTRLVATTDMLSDGVDFRLGEVDPRRIGREALAVNLSDLAAMAASPVGVLVSLLLPRHGGAALARELYEGLIPLAEEFSVPIIGGDTNSWDGPLAISVTALGRAGVQGTWLRSRAHVGDAVVVTGSFGGSILAHQFDFTPRIREALVLAEQCRIHAAMDVSDGLTLDLSRLCAESGCGAELDLAAVPISLAAQELTQLRPGAGSALDHALCDGEDFELLLTCDEAEAQKLLAAQPLMERFGVRLTQIGRIVAEPGLWSLAADGTRFPLEPRGFQHRLD
ncbi:MAG: thiamine-phosphate kinase [Pirellulales bacterium]